MFLAMFEHSKIIYCGGIKLRPIDEILFHHSKIVIIV
jgi:hypothetical protein